MITATCVGTEIVKMMGTAKIYRLDPKWVVEGQSLKYIRVSAATPLGMPETLIFECDRKGRVKSWRDLPGSQRGTLDIEQVMRDAGFKLIEK